MNDAFTRAPHRGAGNPGEYSPHAALLIDFDNVTMGIRSNLGHELRKLLDSDIIGGKVTVQRAYADWRRYPQYIVPLSEASIDLIFAPAYGSSKKNATDIRLAIDALEIVFTRPEIGTFILLSGDSDFSTMVMKLKEYGKYVIGVGMQESSSDLLVQNCDEYYSYTSLAGLQSAADMNTERYDPWELAGQAIERMVGRKDVMRSDRFKQVMLELDQSFSEKSLGFSKFNRFLTEAASRGIIDLHKAANGQYEVGPGPGASDYAHRADKGGTEKPASPPAKSSSRSSSRRGRGGRSKTQDKPAPTFRPEETPQVDEDRLREAYALLQKVVEIRSANGAPVRDSEVKRHMLELDSSFDEGALGFTKFSRFLREAHDEEVINLERNGGGNLLLTATGGTSAEPESRDRRRSKADDGPTPDEKPATEEAQTAVKPDPAPEDKPRRGMGRLRRGRGRGDSKPEAPKVEAKAEQTPEVAPEPVPAPVPEPRAPSRTSARDFDADEAVERMSRTYAGVGRRTAQRMVEEFGADVFDIIDRSPDRVMSALPGHRAQAVIDGRKAELKAGPGESPTAPTAVEAPDTAAAEPTSEPTPEATPEAAPEAVTEAPPAADTPKEPKTPARSRLARRSGGRRR